MPIRTFKHLNSQYVDGLLGGSFRFGRLRYYQLLEIATGDTSVGDRLEGTSITVAHGSTSDADNGEQFRQRLEEADVIRMGKSTEIIMRDSQITNNVDCFVFCTTLVPPEAGQTIDASYNATVEISDIEELAARILNDGLHEMSGMSLAQLGTIYHGRVNYDWTQNDLLHHGAAPADPFQKRALYSGQAEYRIIFVPNEPISSDAITIRVPTSVDLLNVVRTETQNKTAVSQSEVVNFEEEIALINEAYESNVRPLSDAAVRAAPGSTAQSDADAAQRAFRDAYHRRFAKAIFERRKKTPDEHLDRMLLMGVPVDLLLMHVNAQEYMRKFTAPR